MKIFNELPEQDRLGNPIYADFRNMIRLESLMDDDELADGIKIYQALEMLYGERMVPVDILAAYNELLWFYGAGEAPEPAGSGSTKHTPPLYDFEEDAGYIYAAFRQAYGIDLSDAGPFLHWWEFKALFQALPDSTVMAQRIRLRGTDTSELKGKEKTRMEKAIKAVALKKKRTAATSLEQLDDEYKKRVAQRMAAGQRKAQQADEDYKTKIARRIEQAQAGKS